MKHFVISLLALALVTGAAHAAEKGSKRPAQGQAEPVFVGKASPVAGALALSADGRTGALISDDNDVVIWDAVSLRELERIPADDKRPTAVALSPDGERVAIGYADSRVVVWSRRAHKPLRELAGHSRAVSALAFSPDGRLLASGAHDATTQVWEVESGKRLRIFDSRFMESEGGSVVALAFTGDGRGLLVGEWYDRHYDEWRGSTFWDLDDGIELVAHDVTPPNSVPGKAAGQAVGSDGWLFAYAGMDGLMVERLDRCEAPHRLRFGRFADTVSVDPDGRWVAAAEGERLTFSAPDGGKQFTIALPEHVLAMAPRVDGRFLFVLLTHRVGEEGRANLYRVPVPAGAQHLPAAAAVAHAARCAPSEALRKQQVFQLPEHPAELKVIARLVPAPDMAPEKEQPSYMASGSHAFNPPVDIYFSPEGKLYALYFANMSEARSGVIVWDPQVKRALRWRFQHYLEATYYRLRDGWAVRTSDFAPINLPTGKHLFPTGPDERYHVSIITTDADTGEVYRRDGERIERYSPAGRRLRDLRAKEDVAGFAARNGRLAALLQRDLQVGAVQVWELQAGGGSQTFKLGRKVDVGGCEIDGLELSADGRYVEIAYGCVDSPEYNPIYDLRTGKTIAEGPLLAPFPAHASRVVVPDARPNHLAVWDLEHAAIMARLPRQRSRDDQGNYRPLRAAISDDGRLVASASQDGLIRVWNLDTRQLVAEGRVDGEVTVMAFDAPARQLAVGLGDAQVVVLQLPAEQATEARPAAAGAAQ